MRTFGRAVSLRDFEDLVTASGEVAKAQATWTWDGLGRAIHLTNGATPAPKGKPLAFQIHKMNLDYVSQLDKSIARCSRSSARSAAAIAPGSRPTGGVK